MTTPLLRAVSESGEAVEGVTDGVLRDVLADVEDGHEGFVIVERADDPSGHTYAQTARLEDGSYIMEYRDGCPERHFATRVPDVRGVHQLMAGWAFGRTGWHDGRQWRRLTF